MASRSLPPVPRSSPTLGDWTLGRDNNLDFLRLVGAVLVILAHAFPIAGLPAPRPPFFKGHYGTLGVAMFFVISGFLIAQSVTRSRSAAHFIWSRVLRIYPGLIAVTFLLTVGLGPCLTTLSLGEYFAHPWTYSYVRGALSLFEVTRFTVLPGVFMQNPIVQANGPLWTLQYEWTFYFVLLGLAVTGLLRRPGVVEVLFLASLGLAFSEVGATANLYWTPIHYIFVNFMYFGLGVLAFLHRARIPMSRRIFLVVLSILALGSLAGGFDHVPFVFLMGYVTLYLGMNPGLHLSSLTGSGDYSYGLYVWGWPVAQTVFQYTGRDTSVWLQFVVSSAIALAMAAVSWHAIEKRALRLKNWAPGSMAETKPSMPQFADGIRGGLVVLASTSSLLVLGFAAVNLLRPEAASSSSQSERLDDGLWHPLKLQAVDETNRPRFDDAFEAANGHRVFSQNGAAAFGPFIAGHGKVRARIQAMGSFGGGRHSELIVEFRRSSDGGAVARQTVGLAADLRRYAVQKGTAYELRLIFEDDFYEDGKGDRNVQVYGVAVMSVPE
jgi:peptidoglycan/LPS O-acetylase OafA/YrhL